MIPETYKIDFSAKRLNVVQDSLNRLLTQFSNSPVISQVVSAYAAQYQELYDAIIDLQEQRTLYNVKGVYADAVGRIVGRNRQISYANGTNLIADDTLYSEMLLFQTYKNFNKFSSIPEIQNYFLSTFGYNVSFVPQGIMQALMYIPVGSSAIIAYQVNVLTDSNELQEATIAPFPATFVLSNYFELEVLIDSNGSGKRCQITALLVGQDDDGNDIWSLALVTSLLNATPSMQYSDMNNTGKNCNIQALFVGEDDNGNDVWNLILSTASNSVSANRTFPDATGLVKHCLVQAQTNGVDDNNNDIWSLQITTV